MVLILSIMQMCSIKIVKPIISKTLGLNEAIVMKEEEVNLNVNYVVKWII